MKLYLAKNESAKAPAVVLDDMILTSDLPTTGGSMMLDNYMSLFGADIIGKLTSAGYSVAGKANVGEFGIDLVGETSYYGAVTDANGNLTSASAELVKSGDVIAAIGLDVNGAERRAAAMSGLVYVKPTYGTVSRYGTIPAACSGETVGVTAKTVDDCKAVLASIVGHDDKDGTSLPEEKCALVKDGAVSFGKVAIIKSLTKDIDSTTAAKLDAVKAALADAGITVEEIDCDALAYAKTAWGILMCAELCNNVSRYDGVKYGHRTENYKTIGELYTNSRTEAFGELVKTAILYGSETLSDDNYMPVYDKSLRVRRVICETFAKFHSEYDAIIIPACSKSAYTEADTSANKYIAFDEALYTAPASITGLPTVVVGGVQLIGKAFSENTLFEAAKIIAKEGK